MASITGSKKGMALIKGCTTAVLALTVSIFAVGCGDDGDSSRCGADELYATINGETKCFTTCESVADCDSGERCSGSPSVCLPGSGATTPPDDGTTTPPDNNSGGTTPVPTCDVPVVCADFCTKLHETCLPGECQGPVNLQVSATATQDFTIAQISDIFYGLCMEGFNDPNNPQLSEPGCLTLAAASVENCGVYKSNAELLATNCSAARPYYCGDHDLAGVETWQNACGCERSPDLGKACTTDEGCNPGETLEALCYPETFTAEDGTQSDTGLTGGYCSAFGCEPTLSNGDYFISLDARCGDGGICFPLGNNSPQQPYGICFEGCSSNADCPRQPADGYSCTVIFKDDADKIGFCYPSCETDDDCSSPAEGNNPAVVGSCNAQKYCERSCDPTAATSTCIGNGGTCVATADDATKGFCSYE